MVWHDSWPMTADSYAARQTASGKTYNCFRGGSPVRAKSPRNVISAEKALLTVGEARYRVRERSTGHWAGVRGRGMGRQAPTAGPSPGFWKASSYSGFSSPFGPLTPCFANLVSAHMMHPNLQPSAPATTSLLHRAARPERRWRTRSTLSSVDGRRDWEPKQVTGRTCDGRTSAPVFLPRPPCICRT